MSTARSVLGTLMNWAGQGIAYLVFLIVFCFCFYGFWDLHWFIAILTLPVDFLLAGLACFGVVRLFGIDF